MLAVTVKQCAIIFVAVVTSLVVIVSPFAVKMIVESDRFQAHLSNYTANSTIEEGGGSGGRSLNLETVNFEEKTRKIEEKIPVEPIKNYRQRRAYKTKKEDHSEMNLPFDPIIVFE